MLELWPHMLLSVFVVLVIVFLVVRLRLFAGEGVSGRGFFLAGGVLLVLVSVWRSVTYLTAYNDWFLDGVYQIIDVIWLGVLLIGIALVTIGLALYADHWQCKRREIEIRDQKLSILDNLQRDARGPYQLMALLDMSVKEIIAQLPECAGAVFLLNRNQRQFVLGAGVGFTKSEQGVLEYLPLEHNLVSQALDVGEPLLGGPFDLVDRSGKIHSSRFKSSLVLPLISGVDKIGGILLLGDDDRSFSHQEVRYLQPVAEWLVERIKSARLERELSAAQTESKNYNTARADLSARVLEVASALTSSDAATAFCRCLVGLGSAGSAHLAGIVNGQLQVLSGSEPLQSLSESYKTALVDAVDRHKPLIINQEATADSGRQYVAYSTLVFPIPDSSDRNALLLRREGSQFKLSDYELKTVEMFVPLARLALQRDDTRRVSVTQRRGFQTILGLMQFDGDGRFQDSPAFFLEQMNKLLPNSSQGITFVRSRDGSMKAVGGLRLGDSEIEGLEILPGEGMVGATSNRGEPSFVYGRKDVARALEDFDSSVRDRLYRMLGERGLPPFVAACPVHCVEQVVGVVMLFVFDMTESERGEWERLLTLAMSLYSMRLTVGELHRVGRTLEGGESGLQIGAATNRFNNHLSAIIGNAELAISRPELGGEVAEHLRSIIIEAELAAGYMKDTFGAESAADEAAILDEAPTLDVLIRSFLKPHHISGKLHMIGDRPRELSLELKSETVIDAIDQRVQDLVLGALDRFGAVAAEDDRLAVTSYREGEYVYVDISRHQENFPPVEHVSGFGDYELPQEALRFRPADSYLRHAVDTGCRYAYDRTNQTLTYLSFRFPVRSPKDVLYSAGSKEVSILAVDDQSVILDLVSAMCQSLGYSVKTATSGKEAIQAVRDSRFDIILLDLAMPEMSGLEAAAQIRRISPGLPIVLVTGWGVDIDPAQLEALGIEDVLYKPFRIEQLTEKIQSIAHVLDSR
ncbi:MAG: response regulator [candidate division Zixibacteria bacterium]|nr:response regulator [candidate division Zixibacteria bacterium]